LLAEAKVMKLLLKAAADTSPAREETDFVERFAKNGRRFLKPSLKRRGGLTHGGYQISVPPSRQRSSIAQIQEWHSHGTSRQGGDCRGKVDLYIHRRNSRPEDSQSTVGWCRGRLSESRRNSQKIARYTRATKQLRTRLDFGDN
jgi:hypothetical protein